MGFIWFYSEFRVFWFNLVCFCGVCNGFVVDLSRFMLVS